ncbi:Uma2 family endonuclease [Sphingomonas sp.]|jgi:Uma2 family endonuclease|uniref:Uma2 family endonuclease n=1 Tax=Sphingomonas sp. TaxID=28214 RepID=UPI002D7F01EF|nr:Uma2 family endonuclease [Sphingomonas sp.]HEU0044689.1 Uma2 family endonuclease [Sphingomonas sp.]
MTVHQPIVADTGRVWKIGQDEFLLLEANGSFDSYARTELLDGEIWVVNAIHSRHAGVQAELHGRLWTALAALNSPLKTYIAPSVDISDKSLPEPDLVLGVPHQQGFVPLAKVALVIEISDTTVDVDLGRKLRIYSEARVAEYWVVDVNAGVIHRMWAPAGEQFGKRDEVAFGEPLASATIEQLVIETSGL